MSTTGRNDPCWCGSGRKYKKCHLGADAPVAAEARVPAGVGAGATGRSSGGLSALRTGSATRVLPGRIAPERPVPAHIPRPDYATTGASPGRTPAQQLEGEELEKMRRACRAAREVLEVAAAAVRPGVTTDELDRIAHEATIERGGYPSPLRYPGGVQPYPKSLCTSVNEVICHGIPDDRELRHGDIVNLDATVYLDGYHGDNSVMCLVGDVAPAHRRLVEVTYDAMMAGIGVVKPGAVVADIGKAIEAVADAHGYGVVRAFVGHGVGRTFHCDPVVPHYYEPRNRFVLEPGMTFTIEPMLNLGRPDHRMWPDGWTAVTADLSRSAQWEHTVLVTDDGVEILTLGSDEDPLR